MGVEIIYFIRPDIINEIGKLFGVGKVAVMEKKPCALHVRVWVDVVYPSCVECACPSDKSVEDADNRIEVHARQALPLQFRVGVFQTS